MITYEEIMATGLPLSDHGAIAEALSIGRTELVKTEIGKLSILGAIGMEAGNTLLDTIDTVPDFRHVRYPLTNGWLDVADPTVRSMLDTLCSPEDATKIKNLAVRPVIVSSQEVTKCLDGRE